VSDDEPQRPVLRVVRGEPSAEELAALVAVLSARAAGGAAAEQPRRTAWNHPARLVRAPVSPGHGGWRASSRPA
jgi:hypothetical protein